MSYDHPDQAEFWDWGDINEDKFGRRSITPTDIVEVWENGAVFIRNREGRAGNWRMVGVTNGNRPLTISVRYDATRRSLKPVTGWATTPADRATYEQRRAHG